MFRGQILGVCLLAMILVSGSVGRADAIYNTLDQTMAMVGLAGSGYVTAGSFTTGSNSYTLNSVTTRFGNTSSEQGTDFTLSIYANGANNRPDASPLEVLSGEIAPLSTQNYTYTGSCTLAANTTYWVEARASSTAQFYPMGADNISLVGRSAIGEIWSTDNGATWQSPNSNWAMGMLIDATVVPEPVSLSLLALGSLALLARRRRA